MKLLMFIFALFLVAVLLTGGRAFADEGYHPGVCISEGDKETCNLPEQAVIDEETETETLEVEAAQGMAEGESAEVSAVLLGTDSPSTETRPATVRSTASAGKRTPERVRCRTIRKRGRNRKACATKRDKRKVTR
jgi:hypothetical protein